MCVVFCSSSSELCNCGIYEGLLALLADRRKGPIHATLHSLTDERILGAGGSWGRVLTGSV